jgi:hypothetical protein
MQADAVKKPRIPMIVADMIAYVVLTFSVGLAASLAIAGAVLLLAAPAQADPPVAAAPVAAVAAAPGR